MLKDKDLLTVDQALSKVTDAIVKRKPFSLVRVGDGENLILAQNSVMTIDNVLKEKWVRHANRGLKGISLPNIVFRDQMVAALKAATMVGIPFHNNDPILTEDRLKRELTDKVFQHFKIKPKTLCHTFVNRVFTQKQTFWEALKGKKIMLIGQWSEQSAQLLRKQPYKLNINLILPFSHNNEMHQTLETIRLNENQFDIALISCGVNAVVLAPEIVEMTGKIAIDFGKSLMFMVKKKAGLNYSSDRANTDLIP